MFRNACNPEILLDLSLSRYEWQMLRCTYGVELFKERQMLKWDVGRYKHDNLRKKQKIIYIVFKLYVYYSAKLFVIVKSQSNPIFSLKLIFLGVETPMGTFTLMTNCETFLFLTSVVVYWKMLRTVRLNNFPFISSGLKKRRENFVQVKPSVLNKTSK